MLILGTYAKMEIIKEEPIEFKDLQETECILIKKESSEETSVGCDNDVKVEKFVHSFIVKSETRDISESDLEMDPLQISSANDTFEQKFKIETIESVENDIKIEPNSYEFELEKEDSGAGVLCSRS